MFRFSLILCATLGAAQTAQAQQAGRRAADSTTSVRPHTTGKVSATPGTVRTAPDVKITNATDASRQPAPVTRITDGTGAATAKKAPSVRTSTDTSAADAKTGAAAKTTRKPPR